MPFKLSRTIRCTTTTNFKNRLTERAITTMRNRMTKARRQFEIGLRDLIEEAIRKSEVYKGLNGDYAGFTTGRDLQAEFGLTNSKARQALEKMVRLLRASTRIQVKRKVAAISSLEINATAMDPEHYESRLKNDEEFWYPSITEYTKRGASEVVETQIQWMTWLLEASTDIVAQTIPSVSNYAINYNLTGSGEARSRSGRALMMGSTSRNTKKLGYYARGFPYTLPRMALPKIKGSRNFIEDIALDRRFRSAATKQLEKIVYQIMKPGASLPNRLRG